jgi:putative Ca2+/H+ antiporter (TMEM165/GDT1 family)
MDWKAALVAFCTLFIAELGDKTQLAVFTLAGKGRNPWPVFIGASLALILVTFLGAFFGGFIARYIPGHVLRLAAGLLFVGIGVFILWSAVPAFIQAVNR